VAAFGIGPANGRAQASNKMADRHGMDGEQAQLWNGPAGRAWVELQAVLDGMLKPFGDIVVERVPAGGNGAVLDVGCGAGATTFASARRLGAEGRCVGVDISEPLIAAARSRAEREGVEARFIHADAQTHDFEPSFDMIISRFGVMFFEDPVQAFANLRRAAGRQAALRFVAWRSAAENPFMTTAERAAAPLLPNIPARLPEAPGQFAFADQNRVRRILEEAGWSGMDIRPVDLACALPEKDLVGYFTRLGPVGRVLQEADDPTRTSAIATIRAAFDPYVKNAKARFDAACWLVDAKALS
jgi:ubiquinone/menaquinone biosynthesis C-methylase UbiE